MAGRGPAPKTNAVRRNKQPSEELSGRGAEAPPLFKRAKYSTATQRWWDTWANSPQAEAFLDTDWERLQMLAPMVESYWQGDLKLLAEIRLNEERLGATIRDRQSLRMKLDKIKNEADEDEQLPENVVDIELYHKLGGA
ncbi:hypothetical protein OHA25_13700 [Nonomuraea sp. NBC_00507]|uniref:phage terminase small subunit n=1 Tax=Nonomuraea sp. NBC_00507 TaxID=2976002 RepID=UPI002E18F477